MYTKSRIISNIVSVLVSATLWLLSACDIPPPPVASNCLPIHNGFPVSDAETEQLGVVRVIQSSAGRNCTGVLITNEWVLTADHCKVIPHNEPGAGVIDFIAGSGRVRATLEVQKVVSGAELALPFYTDIKLVQTVGAFSINGSKTGFLNQIYTEDDATLLGKDVTIYGLGPCAPNLDSFGLTKATLPITQEDDYVGPMLTARTNDQYQSVVGGDSGGPWFYDDGMGHKKIVTVTEAGSIKEDWREQYAIGAPPSLWRDWLKSTIGLP
jgi:hypothetical protein